MNGISMRYFNNLTPLSPIKILGIFLASFCFIFSRSGLVSADVTSGWEVESALVKTKTHTTLAMHPEAGRDQGFHNYSTNNPQDFVHKANIKDFTIHNPQEHGIKILQGWNVNVSDMKIYNDVRPAYFHGVLVNSTRESVIQNSSMTNFDRGIFYSSNEKVDTINNIIQNTFAGIEYNGGWTYTDPVLVKNNKIENTYGDGMYLYSLAPHLGEGANPMIVSGNTVESSGLVLKGIQSGIGLVLSNDIIVDNNIIKGNWNGIRVESSVDPVSYPNVKNQARHIIRNNNIYNNSNNGILFYDVYANPIQVNSVYSNTIYSNTQDGIENSHGHNITLKNNIVANNKRYGVNGNTLGVYSYNNVYNNTLSNYNNTVAGTGDIFLDPLFADPANGDFHLQSQAGRWNGTTWVTDLVTSPAIDAGDSASDYSLEPLPNGRRVNMGIYGNTAEASKSTAAPWPPDLPGKQLAGKISVYPNPYINGKSAGEKITFANLPTEATIKIYTSSGELVKELTGGSDGKAEWNVNSLGSGVYLYVITSAEGIKKGKISVIK